MISKRGTTFSDFLRGLLVDDSVPEASNIRQGRQLRPATSNPHPNGNQDQTSPYLPKFMIYTDLGSLVGNTQCGNFRKDFSATQILCEINFGHFEDLKNCHFFKCEIFLRNQN